MHIAKWIFAVVFFTFSANALSCPGADCVRVGSWNIAWLGSENRKQPADLRTIEEMASMIAGEWSMDLISLQEINTAIDGDLYGEHYSTQQWKSLRDALHRKGYQTAMGNSGNAQRIVFAWRAPVKILQSAEDMSIPDSYLIDEYCRSSNLRKPLAGFFRAGNFDFWAIGVHLKSGYGGKSDCNNAVREMQAYYLAKKLDDLYKKDRDIVLVGDFNTTINHASLQALRDKGFLALTDKHSRAINSNNASQGSEKKRGSVIDHVMINPGDTTEWIKKTTVLYKPDSNEEFSKQYSDHVPVWTDFNTRHDDD